MSSPNMTVLTPIPAAGLTVAYTGTAGTTAAINANADVLRVVATTDCFIEISIAGTAAVANTGCYLPAYSPEYFSCPKSAKVSAIQLTSGGSIYVTPMA